MSKELTNSSDGASEGVIKASSSDTNNSKLLEANCSLEEEKSIRCASIVNSIPEAVTETLRAHSRSFQFSNIDSVSSGDMYLYENAVRDFGKKAADYLAKKYGWQVNNGAD